MQSVSTLRARAPFAASTSAPRASRPLACRASAHDEEPSAPRRAVAAALFAAPVAALLSAPSPAAAVIKGYEPMPLLEGKDYGKSRMSYSDYVSTDSGLQYQDLVEGNGAVAGTGDTVLVDWSGVTIGYYGRPFEARNKPRGGAFTGDEKDFFKFKVGESGVLPAFNEALVGMKVGGIRRIIVPVEIGYPNNDLNAAKPSPQTFSGKRALDFVLRNQGMIDKTLLMDIELLRIL